MSASPELGSLTSTQLRALVEGLGEHGYRAQQIREAAWTGRADGFEAVPSLPVQLRRRLSDSVSFQSLKPVLAKDADQGLTRKLLLRARDGQEVEEVLIRHPGGPGRRARNTVCISSQVGCAIGCIFCATGQLGLRRNLSVAEIVDQVRIASTTWHRDGLGAPTNVVFMGMGEPLQNLDAVIPAIELLRDWGVSPRNVVVSTSGLVPEVDRLAQTRLPLRLAISLHAANDRLRDRLVPLNRRYPLDVLLPAARRFASASGRRVSLEYVLIRGVNDSPADAQQLRRLARENSAHVNVIPMNAIPGSPLQGPSERASRHFAKLVGWRATVRFSRGDRATAACGQLRASMAPVQRRVERSASSGLTLLAAQPTPDRI